MLAPRKHPYPVTIDSSTAEVPDSTIASTGIFSPGRTTISSPTATSSTGISVISASCTQWFSSSAGAHALNSSCA